MPKKIFNIFLSLSIGIVVFIFSRDIYKDKIYFTVFIAIPAGIAVGGAVYLLLNKPAKRDLN